MFPHDGISQKELEQLLKESEEIAQSWEAYLQFCRKRNGLLGIFMPKEGLN